MNETVCAVVVTYNRKELLVECLDALLKQTRPLDAIYIIDNASTDKTPELLKEKGYIQEFPPKELTEPWEREFSANAKTNEKAPTKIHYVRMYENTGGAGGFYEGVKRGYERGYDWLWLMDDDVRAKENGLETMLRYGKVAECIHPSKEYYDGAEFHWDYYFSTRTGRSFTVEERLTITREGLTFKEVNYGCFEGMFIHRRLVKKIGLPDPRFFIYGDDTVYGFLASKEGKNIYIPNVCLIKMLKPQKKASHFWGLMSGRQNTFHLYYGFRNMFLVAAYLRRYDPLAITAYWFIAARFVRGLIGIILLDERKLHRIHVLFRALLDGFQGRWGKCEIPLSTNS